jgi:acyl-CoA thioester hydrolase
MDAPLRDHTSLVRPRPNDFDWALQLNNSVFVELFETGRWDWAMANGLELRRGSLVGAVARLEIDYQKPVFWDPMISLQVTTSLDKLERFSLYLQQRVLLDGELMAAGRLRLVLFDKHRRVMVPIHLEQLRCSP